MKRPEQAIQKAVFQHLAARAMPGVYAFHCPNGGKRSKIEASIFKSLGVRAGVPDIIAIYRGTVHALELKASYGRLSPNQKQALEDLKAAGAHTAIAHSLDEALVTLEHWGVLRRDSSNRVPETVGAQEG